MSKHYIVNCYTCQHNGQETCKGCNTLLVGENEPYENWQLREDLEAKDQRIAELEEQLKNCIKPKFNRQEHIYCVTFGEIREFVVVAYLDNNITLCEDTTTSKLEWCDNKFLVLTKEEAEAKLKELEEQECVK